MIVENSPDDLERMAAELDASGSYRVLRRIPLRSVVNQPDDTPTRQGLLVDVETTGLDPRRDEIIELAMVPFTYGIDGRVFEIGKPFARLRQPMAPIPARITEITGITNEMVLGRTIDAGEVAAFVNPAAIVIAHNASFDRRFLEADWDVFRDKPWACSMTQVDWAREGFEGGKLAYLAYAAGFFYDRHRAVDDCLAAIELLARPLPKCGLPALQILLEKARQPTWRIVADGAPFELKEVLKDRGYRWNDGVNGAPRAWYVDVDEADKDAEIAFLMAKIQRRDFAPLLHRIDAYQRFSDRS